ncbi:MAG: hypothetical protein E7655_06710 [Ruminococcaceae bacterium]|nr:hypothetical protein [Oscillospiraceae bacterium]
MFQTLLNMALAAGWLVPMVILLRLLLKKAPRWIVCLLWAMVGLRLMMPVTFESDFSLIPSAETLPADIGYAQTPVIESGFASLDEAINPTFSERFAPQDETASVNPIQIWMFVFQIVWQVGVVCMLLYALISYLRLRRRVRVCLPLGESVYASDGIATPFILGMLRPRIYLPSALVGEGSETLQSHVLAHERAHLKRGDHLWKPLAFALLTVYWFHPLFWVAYILFCRDIEAACDEKVIRAMDDVSRKSYSRALLACSIGENRLRLSACPLAFGEVGVKKRIEGVLHYKKPAFWLICLAVLVCAVAAVCFLTDPASHAQEGLTVEGGENSILITGGGSELEGVEIRIEDVNLSDSSPSMTVQWINRRESDISCGAAFTLSRLVNGEWQDCDLLTERVYYAIAYRIQAGREHELRYGFTGMDLRESGRYRFETECTEADVPTGANGGRTYRVWLEFELEKGIDADVLLPPAVSERIGPSENAVTYLYPFSPDWMPPSLRLDETNKTFSFSYSGFSSYLPFGHYTEENGRLTLKTDDGLYTYVFDAERDGYAFHAALSSTIPSYRYSADAEEAQCPVPDGALFRRVYEVDEQNVFSFPLDRCFYDIDGDGREDALSLLPGPTSGRSTFLLSLSTADGESAKLLLELYLSELSFEETEEGLLLVGKNDADSSIARLPIAFVDGQLVVDRDASGLSEGK